MERALTAMGSHQPAIESWLKKVADTLNSINSFEDLERVFLRGQGLAAGTYRVYLGAVKEFYDFCEGLTPFQWTPSWIEQYYDNVRQNVNANTAYVKVAALRSFCGQVEKQFPFWESPFKKMSESLNRKLRTTDKPKRKVALYRQELLAVLDYLDDRPTLKNKQTKALILTMVTTGLRAAEVVALTADSLEFDSDVGKWYLNGLGKGSKPFRVELHDSAYEAIKGAFFEQFGRDFRDGEHLFYSTESYPGKKPAPMKSNTMYVRLRDLGARLKTLGLIRQNVEFSAHLFRRTFLTQLARGGMDVASLQQAGRHSSFDTTLKHYLDAQAQVSPYIDKMLEKGAA